MKTLHIHQRIETNEERENIESSKNTRQKSKREKSSMESEHNMKRVVWVEGYDSLSAYSFLPLKRTGEI